MIAGRGTPDQGPAHALKAENPAALRRADRAAHRGDDRIPLGADRGRRRGGEAVRQLGRIAEGRRLSTATRSTPAQRIIAALKARHPGVPVIAFPREAGERYIGFAKATGADCVALDNSVERRLGGGACAGRRLRAGQPRTRATWSPAAQALVDETRRIVQALLGRAAYLQPRPRHHAGRRPGERRADDRHAARSLTARCPGLSCPNTSGSGGSAPAARSIPIARATEVRRQAIRFDASFHRALAQLRSRQRLTIG